MTIDFATIKAEAKAQIMAVSGLPSAQVYWRDESKGSSWAADPCVSLRIGGIVHQGCEEELATYVNASSDQTMYLAGQRQFMLSVRAESFEQDVSKATYAGTVIDQIATRLFRWTAIYGRTSFGIEDALGIKAVPYKSDGRQMSCFVLDLLCRTVDNDLDTSTGAGGYINEVFVNGTVDSNAVSLDVKGV